MGNESQTGHCLFCTHDNIGGVGKMLNVLVIKY